MMPAQCHRANKSIENYSTDNCEVLVRPNMVVRQKKMNESGLSYLFPRLLKVLSFLATHKLTTSRGIKSNRSVVRAKKIALLFP
jgi:hypothetical protein